ncbi:uncharacterized protein KY384_004013 [Bacidia gigantensis]|uniref:uncharacterized protein n=1 Tax=Bacidia gigantensis TaxID=2732470 RepID=UPI001D04270F|nr:uncharacterized protein KY384_004013 [Bacidia gigantensis]KAG8530658.1 hypothetical protein KY384_004013 [Bacidia gigantensis]
MGLLIQVSILLTLPLLYYLLPYYQNRALHGIPGPKLAALSNFWLLYQCRRGRRYKAVDDAHQKYGPLVRLQPNHVSVADPEAIPVIYSHTGGWLKSEYYDAFVSIRRGLFNTRSRAEHTRKRKTISHTFSAKSIAQFEPYIVSNLHQLRQQWDSLCPPPQSNTLENGNSDNGSNDAFTTIDALPWLNYLAFDIIGDLAFGAPFGMLAAGADVATVQLSPNEPARTAPAVQVLNRRGEVSATLGCLPALKPWAGWLPDRFFRDGINAVKDLAGIAVARVGARLAEEEEEGEGERKGRGKGEGRKDLLARLMDGRDENGEKLGREELTAEALTQLIAGSDTTSNTSCAGLYWILKTEGVQERLQAELDAAVPADVGIPSFEMVKDLS